jgi:hypothetical protein
MQRTKFKTIGKYLVETELLTKFPYMGTEVMLEWFETVVRFFAPSNTGMLPGMQTEMFVVLDTVISPNNESAGETELGRFAM